MKVYCFLWTCIQLFISTLFYILQVSHSSMRGLKGSHMRFVAMSIFSGEYILNFYLEFLSGIMKNLTLLQVKFTCNVFIFTSFVCWCQQITRNTNQLLNALQVDWKWKMTFLHLEYGKIHYLEFERNHVQHHKLQV